MGVLGQEWRLGESSHFGTGFKGTPQLLMLEGVHPRVWGRVRVHPQGPIGVVCRAAHLPTFH